MRQHRFMAALVCVMILLLALMPTAFAAPGHPMLNDAGNFNDYDFDVDFDGGSDWGGSGGGSFGDVFALLWLFGDSPVVMIVIVVVIILGVLFGKKGHSNAGHRGPRVNVTPPQQPVNNGDVIVAAIHGIDPLFSEDKFLGWAKEVYLTLQQAWMERDWSRIRPFEKEELYRQHQMQLQEYIDKGRINVMERININQAYLNRYERDAEYEHLTVYLQVRMVDYIIDEKTKKVLVGDPNRDSHLKYLMTFTRKTGVLTDPAVSNKSTVSCPHCGAPTEITSAGKCEYCGFVVTTGEYDWVLSDMEGVKPGTSVDNRGVIIRG